MSTEPESKSEPDADRSNLESPHANQPQNNCAHARIENDDWPDELAIFDAREGTADGVWVSASGESFVDLENVR